MGELRYYNDFIAMNSQKFLDLLRIYKIAKLSRSDEAESATL